MEFKDEEYTVNASQLLVVSEKFGSADVYGQNAKSILNKATGCLLYTSPSPRDNR